MMSTQIQQHVGDLLRSVRQGIIVHGCNAQGVMGGGFALQVKRAYPGAYEKYRKTYCSIGLRLGSIVPYEIERPRGIAPLVIVNAITQNLFGTDRRYVEYPAVHSCFEETAKLARCLQITDVHFPLIGCGLAGGDWKEIEPIICKELDGLSAHLWTLPS